MKSKKLFNVSFFVNAEMIIPESKLAKPDSPIVKINDRYFIGYFNKDKTISIIKEILPN